MLKHSRLSELAKVAHQYATGTLPASRHPVILVELEAGFSNDAVGDPYAVACARIMAGLEAWQPSAIILDLRGSDYSWGDGMEAVLSVAQRWYEGVYPMRRALAGDALPTAMPMAVVASDRNRDGLRSLLEGMDRSLEGVLVDSIEQAVQRVDGMLVGVRVL